MSITLYQPVLPPEGTFTDAELSFMDDSPPGLFPENQNSNFGLILRKVYTDKIQNLIGQQQTLYNEDFVATSVQYLDMWEKDYGLPMAPAGRSITQRRQDVLSRIQKGPFTRSRRAAAVENFIIPTFGAGALLFPAGITIGSGIPLYSGLSSLTGTYVIRENYVWKNLCTNPSFETNVSGWFDRGSGSTLTQDTIGAKYGTKSMKIVNGASVPSCSISASLAIPIGPVTISAWVSGTGTAFIFGNERTAADANVSDHSSTPITLTSIPQRISVTYTPAAGNTMFRGGVTGNAGATVYIDGVQIELGSAATDWSDPAGQDFFYEVRILNAVTPDLVALNRELLRITPAGISFVITSTPYP